MSQTPKFFIVEAKALPEIFLKVAEAKRVLELREADTVNEATQMVGISRSAFYKYKDSIRPFNESQCLCRLRRQYSHHQPIHPHRRRGRGNPVGGDLKSEPPPGGSGAQCGAAGRCDRF